MTTTTATGVEVRAAGRAVPAHRQFMTAAVAIYAAMGFRRAPAFDFDATSRFALGGVRPVPVLGYRLDLSRQHRPGLAGQPTRSTS